jgi:TM2 domain-containing membrane protein YozV
MESPVVCPYCRMPFDEQSPPKIYCTACGMPHHEDCYQENGGCTVFGCTRAPADDPKLQVSYSDLQAAGNMPVGAALQPQTTLHLQATGQPQTAAVSPSRYGGPLGVASPGSPAASAPAAAYAQPIPVPGYPSKSRTAYILLGVFLGAFGVHNFYAGYIGRAVAQLCLSVLTGLFLSPASWIWAIVEICVVNKDSAGIQFS